VQPPETPDNIEEAKSSPSPSIMENGYTSVQDGLKAAQVSSTPQDFHSNHTPT
jgi:hypothetical protein